MSSGTGCAVPAQHPSVQAECPGPGSAMGRIPRAWPFHSCAFRRNFLQPPLGGSLEMLPCPAGQSWGTHICVLYGAARTCLPWRMLCPGFSSSAQSSARGFAEPRIATQRQEFSISYENPSCGSRNLNWRGEPEQKPSSSTHTHQKPALKTLGRAHGCQASWGQAAGDMPALWLHAPQFWQGPTL